MYIINSPSYTNKINSIWISKKFFTSHLQTDAILFLLQLLEPIVASIVTTATCSGQTYAIYRLEKQQIKENKGKEITLSWSAIPKFKLSSIK